jgi:hypothetical protein
MSGPLRGAAAALLLAALCILSSCAVSGPGYGDGYAVGYVGGDYYEPWGYEYGGWGGRYRVGPPPGGPRYGGRPPAGGGGHGGFGGGHGGGGRSAPSIPGRPR